jgi:hypothetical protein
MNERSEITQVSTDPNGGESAFPLPHGHTQVKRWQGGHGAYQTTEAVSTGGLTKREYFAAMAMQGIFAHGGPLMPNESAEAAEYAVRAADALLKELAK